VKINKALPTYCNVTTDTQTDGMYTFTLSSGLAGQKIAGKNERQEAFE